MTKEEALNILHNASVYHPDYLDALNMAIKALEEESILDKVKAEIEKQEKWLLQAGYNAYNVDIAFGSIKSVLAESEET